VTDDLAQRLAEMRTRRLNGLREAARREIIMQLLEETGSVSVDDVERDLARWEPPSDVVLADQLAVKTAAMVQYERRAVMHAEEMIGRLEDKAERFERLLEQVREQLTLARAEVETARETLADAEELADYAASSVGVGADGGDVVDAATSEGD